MPFDYSMSLLIALSNFNPFAKNVGQLFLTLNIGQRTINIPFNFEIQTFLNYRMLLSFIAVLFLPCFTCKCIYRKELPLTLHVQNRILLTVQYLYSTCKKDTSSWIKCSSTSVHVQCTSTSTLYSYM